MSTQVTPLIDAMPNSHAEVEAFRAEFVLRFESESEASFAESYREGLRDRAREIFTTYLDVITESFKMCGIGGYGWPRKPTEEDVKQLIFKQRRLRNELRAIDEGGERLTENGKYLGRCDTINMLNIQGFM